MLLLTDAYDNGIFGPRIESEEARQVYLQNLFDKAVFTHDVEVTTEDHILLLTTCSSESTNGREILAAKIADERFDNPFVVETAKTSQQVSVDQQSSWENVPMWLKIILPVVVLMLLAIVIYHRFKKQ